MRNKKKWSAFAVARVLPATIKTKGGVVFDPSSDIWDYVDGVQRVYVNFNSMNSGFDFPKTSLKHVLAIVAEHNSPAYVVNLANSFAHFLRLRNSPIPLELIQSQDITNYVNNLGDHEKWKASPLRALLIKWLRLHLPGIHASCANYLAEKKYPGNTKGRRVATRDPVEGPFSESEYTALHRAVNTAWGQNMLPQWAAVLTRLLSASGGRISQYASLKILDLQVKEGKFVLSLPLAKKSTEHMRASFKEFELSPQNGRFAFDYAEHLKAHGFGDDSPLFPQKLVVSNGKGWERPANDLFSGHCTSSQLSYIFTALLQEIAPPTPRLNFQKTPISTYRFRYTFATRLAEEGASPFVIADRLCQADTQQAKVYVENSPKFVDRLDEKVGPLLAPLAELFAGRIVRDEEHSTAGGALGSRIVDFKVSKEGLASCQTCGKGCTQRKPEACYTCFRFEPWLDAPHELVLERLENERRKSKADLRLMTILDDTILAVQQVIAECNLARAAANAGGSI